MNSSAVIPLYNKAQTIGRAVDSVLAQTRQPDEIVVVDDGSTDGGGDFVEARYGARVRLIRQVNGGVSAARNRGVGESTAARIAFLDADDEWYPGFLEAHDAAWTAFPDLVASFTNYDKNAGVPELHPEGGSAFVLKDYCGFCLSNRGKGMWSSGVMASRKGLLASGGFPLGRTHGEDLDTWVRLAWSGRIAFIPGCLATYHMESGDSGRGIADLDITDTYRQWLQRDAIPDNQRRTSSAMVALSRFRTIHYLARAGRVEEAWRRFREMTIDARMSSYGLAAWLSLVSFPAGRLAFSVAERINRGLALRRWAHTWQ